jgi:hypothetical protein
LDISTVEYPDDLYKHDDFAYGDRPLRVAFGAFIKGSKLMAMMFCKKR